ncbi:MAG: hypothetical protein C5B51_02890 [Terriglobia bacterium]|nr:MAG: hypothetical protein C5B51_02890 [Terriglobia bacterium]
MRAFLLTLAPLLIWHALDAGELPAGKGKEVTDRVCGGCHEAGVVAKYHNSKEDWQSIVEDMKARGADGSEEDFRIVTAYLVHFFGPEINVNKAPAQEMAAQLELTSPEAEAIVNYRSEKGAFRSFADLKKVPGLDVSKLEPIQQRIVY